MNETFKMEEVKHAFRATDGLTFPMPHDAGEDEDKYRHSVVVENAEIATRMCEVMSKELDPANYRLFWCSGRDYLNGKYWLAASPQVGGKGNALNHVRTKLSVAAANTMCAGDSGNDLPMFELLQGPESIRGVAVANAADELVDFCSKNQSQHLLLASRKYAHAILEGMAHFGFSAAAIS